MRNLSLRLARGIFEAAPDAIIVVDHSGVIRFANRQASALFGLSYDGFVGKTIESLMPERFRSGHSILRQTYTRNLRVRPMGAGLDLFALRRDGTEFPVEINLSPIDDGGNILVAAAIRDITDRKRVEAELSAQLDDLRRLRTMTTRLIEAPDLPEMLEEVLDAAIALQHADFGNIQLLDATTGILRMVTHRGFSSAFLKHYAGIGADSETACARALRTGERVIIDNVEEDNAYLRHRETAAKEGYRAVQSTPIRGRGGIIKGMLSTHFRQPHCPSNRELQLTDIYVYLVAELIARFQNEEAMLARQASELKSWLLATANHDLRHPLQSAVLYLSELFEQVEGPKERELCDLIQGPLDEMTEILDALLDVSRLERGAVTAQVSDFDVSKLVQELIINNWPQAHSKGLHLTAEGCECLARSDPALLKRILDNFISNAIRYTDVGDVTVRCHRTDSHLRISVTDTGKGIPADKLETIFDDYVQLDNPGRSRQKGLGLGLSIAKHIAKILCHRIEATSTVGRGSTFSVELPAGSIAEDQHHNTDRIQAA